MSPDPPPELQSTIDRDEFEASLTGEADPTTDVGLDSTVDLPPAGVTPAQPLPSPAPPETGAASWAGKSLSKFKLVRLLGEGTMGMVIQAQDIHLGRIVALKVLRKRIKGMDQEKQVQQFLREAKAAARLDHPNVARVYEIDQHKGWWYIATEYLEGGSLRQLIKATGPLSPPRACPIIADAASALAVAHQQGMTHRDIKPSNIMLTRTGRAKLVDFGLVRIDDPNDPFDFTEQAVGTPNYMPPEVARRQATTAAVDVYSLGATLFYLLVGRAPFHGESVKDIIRCHVEAPRPDLREHVTGCTDSLAALVKQMMSVDPAQRPSMADVSSALRAETIGLSPNDTDIAVLTGPDGSTMVGAVGPERFGSRTGLPAGVSAVGLRTGEATRTGTPGAAGDASRRRSRRALWSAAAVTLVLVIAALIALLGRDDPGAAFADHALDRAAFAARFPDAPPHYGTRAAGDAFDPAAAFTPPAPPPFSWRLAPDANEAAAYVAHAAGRLYFPFDHPRAGLIPADRVVFFATTTDAERAGKAPAK